jgi:acyl-CoA dehydrogenase
MTILHDEGQLAIAREASRVLAARHDKALSLALVERSGAYDEDFWATAREQGWTGIGIPEAFGGLGLGLIEAGLVAQAAGAATAGAPFLTGNFAAARILLASGDASAQARWLPKLASGEAKAAIAFAEGTEPLPELAATMLSGGLLTGAKPGVTAGTAADVAIVWARGESSEPVLAVTDLAGATRTPVASFDNARLFADLAFAGSPATPLVEGTTARKAALDALAAAAVITAHEQVGGAEALMETARDYANTRRAFGQPIGAFQSVKHRIAELYGLVEIARANAIRAAAADGTGEFLRAAAAARLSATEAYDTAARDAVQIHGGIGVTWEAGLHLHMRRARSLAIEQGNMMFWEDLLVRELGWEAAA